MSANAKQQHFRACGKVFLLRSTRPVICSQWEILLLRMGISEAEALRCVEKKRDGWKRIRRFAEKQRKRAFVPTPVLSALGLEIKDEEVSLGPDAGRRAAAWTALEQG